MHRVYFISHPEVVIDPIVPVPQWSLSEVGKSRMSRLANTTWMREVEAVWSSTERKAMDCAAILGSALSLAPQSHEELGENDRTATGYLEKLEFENAADEFFANPAISIRGWERAIDAQSRICRGVEFVLARSTGARAIALCAHGGVGALYLCKLKGVPISRAEDQPSGRGNYYAFEVPGGLVHGWRPIDE